MALKVVKISAITVILLFLQNHDVHSFMNDCGVLLNVVDVGSDESPLVLKYQGKRERHFLEIYHTSYLDSECLVRNLYVGNGLASFACLGHSSLQFPGLKDWPDNVRLTSLIGARSGTFDNFTVITPEHPTPISFDKLSSPIRCTKAMEPTMKQLKGSKYQIGYQMNILDFLPVFELTFNDHLTFAHAKILSIIDRRPRINENNEILRKGPLFKDIPVTVAKLGSKIQLSSELKEMTRSRISIDRNIEDNYLVHGQLLSKDDLFYIPEQRTTFFFENTALIWNSINDGNWRMVGDIVRSLAYETVTDFDIYSGTLQCLNFSQTPVYLYSSRNLTKQQICIPKFLFKIALDYRYDLQRGTVFITVNDPNIQIAKNGSIPSDFKLCDSKPECEQLHPIFSLPEKGYTYCCDLNEFAPWVEIQNNDVEEDAPEVVVPYSGPLAKESTVRPTAPHPIFVEI